MAGCLEGTEEDDGNGKVPLTLGLTSITGNDATQSFDLIVKLYDEDDKVMTYKGELRIMIKDTEYVELYDRSHAVTKADFKVWRSGTIKHIDLPISVPYSDLSRVSEEMRDDPWEHLRIYTWFTYDETTINEYELWNTPTFVAIEEVVVDEGNETVHMEMFLYDSAEINTKGTGTLRVIAWDSEEFVMLDQTFEVRNEDYWFRFEDELYLVSYEIDVPYDEFEISHDRRVDKPGIPGILEIGRHMRFGAEFTFGDTHLVTGPEHGAAYNTLTEIPEALLYPNDFPNAALDGPEWVAQGKSTTFSARRSTDDLYQDELTFIWFWGDDNVTDESPMNFTQHAYEEPGEYCVTVMVIDTEGYADLANLTIQVVPNPYVIVNEAGKMTDGGEHHNKSFVNITIWNILGGEGVGVPTMDPVLYDDASNAAEWNGTDGTPPTFLGFNGSVTLVLYFEYRPGGAELPQPFDAVRLTLWSREFQLEA